jgi:tRNA pseudouridine38-40 synthase
MSPEVGMGMEESSDETEEDLISPSMIDSSGSENMMVIPKLIQNRVQILAWWRHEPDESDRLNASHFRDVITCSCGKLQSLSGIQFVELTICGASFMLHQVCDKAIINVQ